MGEDDTFTPPHAFGLRGPDPFDGRDFKLGAGAPVNVDALPDRVDLEHRLPEVMDQKIVSGCVGWAYVQCAYAVMRADGRIWPRRPYVGSPAFVYRECRAIDEATDAGSLAHDWGTYVRNAWKVGNKLGMPLASRYPPRFDPDDIGDPAQDYLFPETSIYRREPPPYAYRDAAKRQMLAYFRCETMAHCMKSLADGFPVQIGFTVFRNFYTTGGPVFDVPMPTQYDRPLGGHSVVLFGYDKPSRRWVCRNQWGEEAHIQAPTPSGTSPNFLLPFSYEQYISDCWTGRRNE